MTSPKPKNLQKISLQDIEKAYAVIKNHIEKTPVQQSRNLFGETEVFFKFENQQLTGSFKIRGALNKISSLSESEKKSGVVASSAGNHAQGVARAAQKAGVQAHIVMPVTAPIVKVEATKSYGAQVILHGDFYDEAYQKARELEKEMGYTFVHPYQDEKIIAGQGSLGLELFEQIQNLDSVVIPIGGGGLISGTATALKALNPKIKIYGVVSDQAPAMMNLFKGDSFEKVLETQAKRKKISTIAEGIAIKNPSLEMHEVYISKLVDDIVSVTDDQIARAIVYLLEKQKIVTEGSGAAGLAAIMNYPLKLGKRSCVVLCGGNIDLNIVSKIIERGQRAAHRLVRFSIIVDDLPGNLSRLSLILAKKRANVLEVYHDRVSPELGLRETRIDFLVETSNQEHIHEIEEALKKSLGSKKVTAQ